MSWPLALGTVKGRLMASNSSEVASLSRMYMSPGIKSLSTFQGKKGVHLLSLFLCPRPLFTSHTWSCQVSICLEPVARLQVRCMCQEMKQQQQGNVFTHGAEERVCNKEVLKITC